MVEINLCKIMPGSGQWTIISLAIILFVKRNSFKNIPPWEEEKPLLGSGQSGLNPYNGCLVRKYG
jgi:hypothetical protein